MTKPTLPRDFGRGDRVAWDLRGKLEHRRQARIAAIACAGLALVAAIGAGIFDGRGQVNSAVVLGMVAALAIVVGAVAASEA